MTAISPAPVESSAPPEAVPAKVPLLPLIIVMVATVFLTVVTVGGGIWYLVHSGRLPVQKDLIVGAKLVAPVVPAITHAMVLEPMVANLADAGGAAYLKMALTLRIADDPASKDAPVKDAKPRKGISDSEAAVRDTVLMVVGRQTADALLAADGKERLKSELKAALSQHNPELKVMDLYFVDFLVQR